MEALLAFAAALLALRLAGLLLRRWRAGGESQFAAWAAALGAYAVASAALAWSSASGWTDASFRVYYLFGGLLTAALLGVGSLLLTGRAWAGPVGLLYVGLAVGVAVAVPLTTPVGGDSIPEAQQHLDFFPARLLAVLGNSAGNDRGRRDSTPHPPPAACRERTDRRGRGCGRSRQRARGARSGRDRGVHRRCRCPALRGLRLRPSGAAGGRPAVRLTEPGRSSPLHCFQDLTPSGWTHRFSPPRRRHRPCPRDSLLGSSRSTRPQRCPCSPGCSRRTPPSRYNGRVRTTRSSPGPS